ncbi:MAG: hypothetical protein GXN93_05285 [Candidatus Diapherotrites archaeon]|nr:hypothetical protein [Candidatus Diapherotrites archaeon]
MRGFAFTLMNVFLLLTLLAVYAAYATLPLMPAQHSYVDARDDAAMWYWSAEYNAGPDLNNIVQGGCVDLVRVIPYNAGIGKTTYTDLNEIPQPYVFVRCAR